MVGLQLAPEAVCGIAFAFCKVEPTLFFQTVRSEIAPFENPKVVVAHFNGEGVATCFPLVTDAHETESRTLRPALLQCVPFLLGTTVPIPLRAQGIANPHDIVGSCRASAKHCGAVAAFFEQANAYGLVVPPEKKLVLLEHVDIM